MTNNDGPPSVRLTGKVLRGKYRVERVLGTGGMGIVVLARHLKLDQTVAIKMLRTEARARPGVVARFAREARAAARLKSEHVVRIFDVDEDDDGAPFFVMEHLAGRDLEQVSADDGAMPIERAVDFVLQACEAVAEAHSLGMVHRDLKPANLFLIRKRDGSSLVKLLDFGISKAEDGSVEDVSLTSPTSVIGSPLYMSPEQLKSSKDVDGRADIWALGVVLFQLLTGATPFDGDNSSALAAKIASEPPRSVRALRADVPDELVNAIERCLAKDLELRFQNAVELARAIAPFAPGAPATVESRIANVARAGEVEDPALGVTMPETGPSGQPRANASSPGTPRVTEAISERLATASSSLAKTTGSPSATSVPPPTQPAEPTETASARSVTPPSRRRAVSLAVLGLAAASAIIVIRSRSTDTPTAPDASFLGASAAAPRVDAEPAPPSSALNGAGASTPVTSASSASAPSPAITVSATRSKPPATIPTPASTRTTVDASSPTPPPASAAKDPLQIEIK